MKNNLHFNQFLTVHKIFIFLISTFSFSTYSIYRPNLPKNVIKNHSKKHKKLLKVNASDSIRYALTTHGIHYILQTNKNRLASKKFGVITTNRWWPNQNLQTQISHLSKRATGSTDCSSLYSNSVAFNGRYYEPQYKKTQVGTGTLMSHAKLGYAGRNRRRVKEKYKLSPPLYKFTLSDFRQYIKHGHGLIWRPKQSGRPGHILLFNGIGPKGRIHTVEARGSGKGVGKMSRTFSELKNYHIISASQVRYNIKDIRYVTPLNRMSYTALYENANNRSILNASETIRQPSSLPAKPTSQTTSHNSQSEKQTEYEVQSGDSLSEIAYTHKTTVDKIKELNPQIIGSRIYIGQIIRLPTQMKNYRIHFVRSGESLSKIAKKYRVNYHDIARFNKIKNPNQIFINDKIKIPMKGRRFIKNVDYIVVSSGDSIGKIARQFDLSPNELKQLNQIKGKNPIIKVGQILWIREIKEWS